MPDFSLESQINGKVCGIDEVGRGPLAGPVIAACVYIPVNKRGMDFIPDIKDSKKLSWTKIQYLYECIREHCVYGVSEISAPKIDKVNILQASLLAMEGAFEGMVLSSTTNIQHPQLNPPPQGEGVKGVDVWHALVDGNRLPANLPCPATAVIKGDNKSTSIAAASILAKVTRDRIMHKLAEEFPYYGWETNVGYPSQKHRDAIEAFGITPHHRKSFKPVREYVERSENESGSQPETQKCA